VPAPDVLTRLIREAINERRPAAGPEATQEVAQMEALLRFLAELDGASIRYPDLQRLMPLVDQAEPPARGTLARAELLVRACLELLASCDALESNICPADRGTQEELHLVFGRTHRDPNTAR
jgi:hypothetical protein